MEPDPSVQRAEGSEEPEETLTHRLLERADPIRRRLQRPVERVSGWAKWVEGLRPYRVYINFSHSDGNLRAAGMGYQSLFAVFAALWLGFSFANVWLHGNPDLYDALISVINRVVPNLIETDTSPGAITTEQLDSASAFGWAGVVAAIGLLWTAIGWLFYTRQAVRAVFGLSRDKTNYVLQKVRDLFLALAFGIVLIASALLTILSTQAVTFILQLFDLSSNSFWTSLAARYSGLLVSVILNTFTLGAMFRVMARVTIPLRNLFFGSLLGAVTLAGLSVLAGLLFRTSSNPLLATFAVFIGLLLWFNLMSRVILLSASWIAVGMFDRGLSPRHLTAQEAELERALAERQARELVASAELQRAREELAAAAWYARLPAQRRVAKAERRLNDVLDEGAVSRPR